MNYAEVKTTSKIVIVGASFAGLAAARKLDSSPDVTVTVIEPKSFFEYTPGILRALVEPEHAQSLLIPLEKAMGKSHHVQGLVTNIEINNPSDPMSGGIVTGQMTNSSGEQFQIQFDHLLLCIGSAYKNDFKIPPTQPVSIESRLQYFKQRHEEIAQAESVLVVGGGEVGVELAAEIIERFPLKKVKLLTRSACLLGNFPPKAQKRAHEWLKQHGVEVIFEDVILHSLSMSSSIHPKNVITKNGRNIPADIRFDCTGMGVNWNSLEDCIPIRASGKDTNGCIIPDSRLQVKNYTMIKVAGDVCRFHTNEDKNGYVAEIQAEYIAACLRTLTGTAKKRRKIRIPAFNDFIGVKFPAQISCVSLGKKDGILIFNSLVLEGWIGGRIAAWMKYVVETTKLLQTKRRLFAMVFWDINHIITSFLEKCVLKRIVANKKTNGNSLPNLKPALNFS